MKLSTSVLTVFQALHYGMHSWGCLSAADQCHMEPGI